MDLKNQRRMAAEIMDVGKNRVWMNPDELQQIDEALTRNDIRNLIEGGAIQKKKEKGTSKGRAKKTKKQKEKGRRKGQGSRKGPQSARKSDKDKWMETIRALRSDLKEMRNEGEITGEQYRELYRKAKGGFFRNRKHLSNYVEDEVK